MSRSLSQVCGVTAAQQCVTERGPQAAGPTLSPGPEPRTGRAGGPCSSTSRARRFGCWQNLAGLCQTPQGTTSQQPGRGWGDLTAPRFCACLFLTTGAHRSPGRGCTPAPPQGNENTGCILRLLATLHRLLTPGPAGEFWISHCFNTADGFVDSSLQRAEFRLLASLNNRRMGQQWPPLGRRVPQLATDLPTPCRLPPGCPSRRGPCPGGPQHSLIRSVGRAGLGATRTERTKQDPEPRGTGQEAGKRTCDWQ